MRALTFVCTVAVAATAAVANAQSTPMTQAFRQYAAESGRNLVAAAEAMPADRYSFKPTPAQRSFGAIMAHAGQANDYLCGLVGGTKAPARTKLDANASKETLIARLRETLAFCDAALSRVDDAMLGEQLDFLGSKRTRAAVILGTTADWESHYSQAAAYLRLNGKVPPTAK
jgi:DinB family protein